MNNPHVFAEQLLYALHGKVAGEGGRRGALLLFSVERQIIKIQTAQCGCHDEM